MVLKFIEKSQEQVEWRKKIRKISEAKKEEKNEETRKKLLKMTLKKRKD